MNILELRDTLVDFQRENDEYYMSQIYRHFKHNIDVRANNAARRFGLVKEDCISYMSEALWEAAKTWDESYGVPFEFWAYRFFNTKVNDLLKENGSRRNDRKLQNSDADIVLGLDEDNSQDVVDYAADIEKIYIEDENAAELYSYLYGMKPTATRIARLVMDGYNHEECAKVVGLESSSSTPITSVVHDQLRSLRNPTIRFYQDQRNYRVFPSRIRKLLTMIDPKK